MITKQEAKIKIQGLVKYFEENFINHNIDEATTRRQLINQLFICLGWE